MKKTFLCAVFLFAFITANSALIAASQANDLADASPPDSPQDGVEELADAKDLSFQSSRLCSGESVWRFQNVGTFGRFLSLTFSKRLVGSVCQHYLVARSSCTRQTANYISYNPSNIGPANIQLLNQTGKSLPYFCEDVSFANVEYNLLDFLHSSQTIQYRFAFLRSSVRFKAANGVWSQPARHFSGPRRIWF